MDAIIWNTVANTLAVLNTELIIKAHVAGIAIPMKLQWVDPLLRYDFQMRLDVLAFIKLMSSLAFHKRLETVT